MVRRFSLVALALVLMAGGAVADTLAVNNVAALQGSFGMRVVHDNSSRAYVEDQSPTGEKTFSASWLMRVNNTGFVAGGANWRQPIFLGIGPIPAPGQGACPANPGSIASARCFLYQTGGQGQNSNVQCWVRGNQCGEVGALRIPLTRDTTYRICMEWKAAANTTGYIAFAAVASNQSCPSSQNGNSTGGWSAGKVTNNATAIDTVRLGTPQQNQQGLAEEVTLDFDDYASYRVVYP